MSNQGNFMSKKQIKDIPSIKKNSDTLKGFKAFKKAFPVLKPILKTLGGDTTKVEDAFADSDASPAQLAAEPADTDHAAQKKPALEGRDRSRIVRRAFGQCPHF
jgi:hypothetical protein